VSDTPPPASAPDAPATLIDSDVLVWLTRGHVGAATRLQAVAHWRISVVTYIELAQGCRDKADLARLKKGLAARNTEIVPLTPAIGERAAELVDSLALSHGMRLADALIGATAIELQATLITANVKHFAAVEGLGFEAFSP
jgi:predicted nucleic acid-binding protein